MQIARSLTGNDPIAQELRRNPARIGDSCLRKNSSAHRGIARRNDSGRPDRFVGRYAMTQMTKYDAGRITDFASARATARCFGRRSVNRYKSVSGDAILVYTAILRGVRSQNLSLSAVGGGRRGCFSRLRAWHFRIRQRAPSSMRHDAYVWDRRVHGRAPGVVDPGLGSAAPRISRIRQRRLGDDRRRSTGRAQTCGPGQESSKSCSSASRGPAPAGSATRAGPLTARPPTAMPIRTSAGVRAPPPSPWCTTA